MELNVIGKKYDVLDKGFVEVYDVFGNDLTVINAARISYGKRKSEIDDSDLVLLKKVSGHNVPAPSPFRHVSVQLVIRAPELVLRQFFRHLVGIESTSDYLTKDMPWNEKSLRYTEARDYYTPEIFRKENKEGEVVEIENPKWASEVYHNAMYTMWGCYQSMIDLGVSKELARSILPLNLYTDVFWTASFPAVMNLLNQRLEMHAQCEIREYAKVLDTIMKEAFPKSYRAWREVRG